MGYGGFYGYRGGAYGAWASYPYDVDTVDYRQGTLSIDLVDASNATPDAEATAVVDGVAAAFAGDGRITGVDAASASLMVGAPELSRVEGTWGVFAADIAVYPDHQDPVSAYYTAIVALNGNEVALGVRKGVGPDVINMHSDFPSLIARGLLFQGASRGWGALDGYMQVIGLKQEDGACAATMPAGVVCTYGYSSAGLEILESAPLPFSGNQAGGGRSFVLGYGDVRGYSLDVYCDEASFC